MTQRQFMEKVIANSTDKEMVDFATDFIAKLDKDNERKRNTLNKTQLANVELKDKMVALLEGKEMDAASVGVVLEISTAKASSLLTQLVAEGKVIKIVGKKKNTYKLA